MIFVVGSINLDLIARVPVLPEPGQTVSGTDFSTAPGGKGANQALAARRAGADVRMIGAVGADTNASAALDLLKDADVDLSAVSKSDDRNVPTGVALILVAEQSGENQIVVIPGANASVGHSCTRSMALSGKDIVVLQMEVPDAANHSAIDAAQTANAISILNIAPYGAGAPELARKADITIANETEFDELTATLELPGADRSEKARAFASLTGKAIIVTLGPAGALGVVGGNIFQVKAPKIDAVDTVGAGDTFCGAFAVGLSEGMTIDQALNLGCVAGALACLNMGAQPAIPNRAEIDKMLLSANT